MTIATAGQLRRAIANYPDAAPLFWQYYGPEHAAIPEDHFEAVAMVLMHNDVFLEELHDLISEWMALTNKRVIEELHGKDGN